MRLCNLRLIPSLVILAGCGSGYQPVAVKSWDLVATGKTDEALVLYDQKLKRPEDHLLKLMDQGIVLRAAKRFEESNQKFFEAARIIEMNGYTHLGEEAVTLISNEEQSTYQGEDFEKVLVHLYLGLNFLELGREDSALVEIRKVNEILTVMIQKGKRPYELNAFARYLGAQLFENAGDLNDALVALRATRQLQGPSLRQSESLKIDLLRVAERMDFEPELSQWRKEFGERLTERASRAVARKQGAVTLLFEAGQSPIKVSSKQYHTKTGTGGTLIEVMIPVAHYKMRTSSINRIRLRIHPKVSEVSTVFNDIESTAIQHLNDRMGRQIAKALLTAGAKAGLGVGVGAATKNQDLGALTALALMMMSEADTRSWLLLPANLQMARVFLDPGTYNIHLDYLGAGGTVEKTESLSAVNVRPLRTTFIQRRHF